MFGITVARLDQITEAEKLRYQSLYCGLCRSLKERYGQVSRMALTYELTFLAMLYNSLYEPEETIGQAACITHPKKKMPYAMSEYTGYAADLSVAFAYHKCLDDIEDDNSITSKAAAGLLERAYSKATGRIPLQCKSIEAHMARIREAEKAKNTPPDETARIFGELLGSVMVYRNDIWKDVLAAFGNHLGRFIYLMDAAVDLKEDAKSGSYNPFSGMDIGVPQLRTILMDQIGAATTEFEKLPLIQDVHIMRSVLYSGVWQKFNHTYDKSETIQPLNTHNV